MIGDTDMAEAITGHKRHMANFCMLTFMVDHFKGELLMDCVGVKRVFNDENQNVMAELPDGKVIPAIDLETEQMEDAILEWKARNPEEFQEIVVGMK